MLLTAILFVFRFSGSWFGECGFCWVWGLFVVLSPGQLLKCRLAIILRELFVVVHIYICCFPTWSSFSAHHGSLCRFFTYELTPFPKWFLLNSIPYVHQLYGIRCRNTILFVLFYLFVALVKPINKSTCINLNVERKDF